jgi:ketosteroid isomerase-like protein
VDTAGFVRDTWSAVARGDLDAMEAALAPDAQWRAVEDGPWNCHSRGEILEVMRGNLARGLEGEIDEVLSAGDHTVVAFRPARSWNGAWPLDGGIRYVVLTVRDGLIAEMKGCADRAAARQYAGIA